MELWLLTLFILFFGTLFLFFSKNKNSNLILSVFWIPALIGMIYPSLDALQKGEAYSSSTNIIFFNQKLTGIVDPLSAIFLLFSSVAGLIYILYRIDTFKQNPMNTIFFACFNVFMFAVLLGIGTTNLFYVVLSVFITNLLFQILYFQNTKKTENNITDIWFSLISFISIGCFVIILFLTVLPETASDFANVINALAAIGGNYCSDIYLLILTATILSIIFISRCLLSTNLFKNEYHLEIILINTLSFALFLYLFARFIGMGAIPTAIVSRYISLAIIAIIAMFFIINLIKKNSVSKNLADYIVILKILSVLGLISASYGYLYKVPAISILGITSALGFFISSSSTDLMLSSELYKYDSDEAAIGCNKFKKYFAIGLLNISGIPTFIGFLGWISLFGGLILGISIANTELRWISLTTLLISLFIYACILYKTFIIFKSNYSGQIEIPHKIEFKKPNGIRSLVTPLICCFIFVSGILLETTCRVIFCPVSFMVGGTKYVDFFNLLRNYAKYFSIFMLCLLLGLIIYIISKLIITRYMQNR